MINRLFIVLAVTCFSILGKGQSYSIAPEVFDFKTVDLWKNDTAFFTILNTGNSPFIFLPIRYNEEVLIVLPKGKIEAGSSGQIKLIYFTQNKGIFKKNFPVYISTSNTPIDLTIKGKIIGFHQDAMLNCPSLVNTKVLNKDETSILVCVQDSMSGKALDGFEMVLKNNFSYQIIEKSVKDRIRFNNLTPNVYDVSVRLAGYEYKNQQIVVSRNSKKFVIKLIQTVNYKDGLIITNTVASDTIIETKIAEEVDEEIEKLRQKFNDLYKDKQIIEKDVVVVEESTVDTALFNTSQSYINLPDFESNGILNKNKYANNNIVFLIDVSSSMDRPEKLPYLKKSVKDMINILRQEDLVTVIIYASTVTVLLQGEPGDNKVVINSVIDQLGAKGLSHGTKGLNIAYANAKKNFINGGNNQIILVSDGLFNSTDFSATDIYKLAKWNAETEKINTSVIGLGKNKEAIDFMKRLSENGSGNFIQIRNETDTATVLINEIMNNSRLY